MDIRKLEQMGMEQGFSHVVLLDCDTIELKPEVRQMCASGSCHKYDKCWSCPPGCGSLEECEARVRQYKKGIIVQTVGELEDALDGEGMMETEARHKNYFSPMRILRASGNARRAESLQLHDRRVIPRKSEK